MHKISIFIIIIIINYNLSIKLCPRNCKCDLYKEKNRADCSGLNLIHPSISISNNVEIFNLSNNSITTLDNESFQGLFNIIKLILHHNAIQEIYFNTFNELKMLTYLDLSYNRLEYFDERTLENNLNLIELNLSGNKFMSLENNPLIISKSLKKLIIKKSHLTHIYPKMFELLPSIKYLDLSKNLFITITTEPFIQLLQINYVNLNKNRLKCDSNTKITLKFFHRNNITYDLNECKLQPDDLSRDTNNFNGLGKKFERMMLDPSKNIGTEDGIKHQVTSSTTESTLYRWKEDLEKSIMEQCLEIDIQDVCNIYIKKIKQENEESSIRIEHTTPANALYLFSNINIQFYMGFFCGALLISILFASIFLCKLRLKRKSNINHQHNAFLRETVEVENQLPSIPTRRVRRRAHCINRSLSSGAAQNTSTVSAQSDFATFISRLFERPTRRNRYYRSINENTARVIRRLSQSNLFNNRLNQHFVNEVRNNSSNNQENINRSDENLANNPLLMHDPRAPLADDEMNDSINDEMNNIIDDEMILRPETPPPSYGDIVLDKK